MNDRYIETASDDDGLRIYLFEDLPKYTQPAMYRIRMTTPDWPWRHVILWMAGPMDDYRFKDYPAPTGWWLV